MSDISPPSVHGDGDGSTIRAIEDALTTLARRVNRPRTHEQLLRAAGIPLERAAYLTLRQVGETAPVRLSDVAATLGVDVSTASRQVRALERSGLVHRIADPHDGRAALLQVTEPGREALALLRATRHRAMEAILAGWTPVERDHLAVVLARLVEDVGRFAEGPADDSPPPDVSPEAG